VLMLLMSSVDHVGHLLHCCWGSPPGGWG
jgi:hypothetical protein